MGGAVITLSALPGALKIGFFLIKNWFICNLDLFKNFCLKKKQTKPKTTYHSFRAR